MPDTIAWLVATLIGYLLGSIPSAFIVGKALGGMDIRRRGSGNVGASNIMVHFGVPVGLAVGTFDCLVKGTLPPLLAAKVFGLPFWGAAIPGLAAVAGHAWSPFIGFRGGRGVATAIGVMLAMSTLGHWVPGAGFSLVALLGWLRFRSAGFWVGAGFYLMPLWPLVLGRPGQETLFALSLTVLLAAKRLMGNWERPVATEPTYRVILYRLLLDRDVRDRKEWIARQRGEEDLR
ncbi:MAG: glycerol-3-phosphate acyltransferase [Chloroflexi bacterium]|nr:glycerol-3-phosphate acyltransferase [Chloroflexota bacterium]